MSFTLRINQKPSRMHPKPNQLHLNPFQMQPDPNQININYQIQFVALRGTITHERKDPFI